MSVSRQARATRLRCFGVRRRDPVAARSQGPRGETTDYGQSFRFTTSVPCSFASIAYRRPISSAGEGSRLRDPEPFGRTENTVEIYGLMPIRISIAAGADGNDRGHPNTEVDSSTASLPVGFFPPRKISSSDLCPISCGLFA
jgi:hypothetical protein